MGLSVGRLNAYWLRDVLAVDLAFEQDADREVVEHDQPAAPAEGVEPRKLGQRPRQAGNHVACERQPLARVLAVLGDETPRPGDVHLCHEVDRVALPADRCGRSNHLSVAAERFGPIPPACAHRLLPAEGVLCPAPWIEHVEPCCCRLRRALTAAYGLLRGPSMEVRHMAQDGRRPPASVPVGAVGSHLRPSNSTDSGCTKGADGLSRDRPEGSEGRMRSRVEACPCCYRWQRHSARGPSCRTGPPRQAA